jgi:sugar-specific transcriptional regulator TrmB
VTWFTHSSRTDGNRTGKGLEDQIKAVFRLNSYEARAYLALLRVAMGPNELSAAARVPKPRIYDILGSLVSKGFVTKDGDRYVARSPRSVLELTLTALRSSFEAEESRIRREGGFLVERLGAFAKMATSSRGPVLVKGLTAIASLLFDVLGTSAEVCIMLNKALERREDFRVLLSGVETRSKVTKVLVPSGVVLEKEDYELATRFGAEIRALKGFLMDLMITDSQDVIIGFPDPLSSDAVPVVAIHVHDASFCASLRRSFEQAWEISDKLP